MAEAQSTFKQVMTQFNEETKNNFKEEKERRSKMDELTQRCLLKTWNNSEGIKVEKEKYVGRKCIYFNPFLITKQDFCSKSMKTLNDLEKCKEEDQKKTEILEKKLNKLEPILKVFL